MGSRAEEEQEPKPSSARVEVIGNDQNGNRQK